MCLSASTPAQTGDSVEGGLDGSYCVGQVVVENYTSLDHIPSLVWQELNCPAKNPPACRHDAKGIFNYPPGSGEAVIENGLLPAQVCP